VGRPVICHSLIDTIHSARLWCNHQMAQKANKFIECDIVKIITREIWALTDNQKYDIMGALP